MKTADFKYRSPWGFTQTCYIEVDTENKEIQVYSFNDDYKFWEPYATATVIIPGLSTDEYAIKDYSENDGILDMLLEQEVVVEPHRYAYSGYVMIPICRLSPEFSS